MWGIHAYLINLKPITECDHLGQHTVVRICEKSLGNYLQCTLRLIRKTKLIESNSGKEMGHWEWDYQSVSGLLGEKECFSCHSYFFSHAGDLIKWAFFFDLHTGDCYRKYSNVTLSKIKWIFVCSRCFDHYRVWGMDLWDICVEGTFTLLMPTLDLHRCALAMFVR